MARRDDDDDDYDDEYDDEEEDERPRRKSIRKKKKKGGSFVDVLLFRQMMGTPLIFIIFVAGVLYTSYWSISLIIDTFSNFGFIPWSVKLRMLAVDLSILLLGPVFVRLGCELMVLSYRLVEILAELNETLKDRD